MPKPNFTDYELLELRIGDMAGQDVYPPLAIIGLVLNVVSVFVLLRSESLRRMPITIVLITKLIVCNLNLLCCELSWSLEAAYSNLYDYYPSFLCVLRLGIGTMTMILEPFCVLLTTVDRLLATALPLRYKLLVNHRRMLFATVAVIVLFLPIGLLYTVTTGVHDGQCWYRDGYKAVWAARGDILNVTANSVPIVLVVLCSAGIIYNLRINAAKVASCGTKSSSTAMSKSQALLQRSVTMAIGIDVVLMLVFGLPNKVANVYYKKSQVTMMERPDLYAFFSLLFKLTAILDTVSQLSNFFVFCACLKNFRKQVKLMCAAMVCQHNKLRESHVSTMDSQLVSKQPHSANTVPK